MSRTPLSFYAETLPQAVGDLGVSTLQCVFDVLVQGLTAMKS